MSAVYSRNQSHPVSYNCCAPVGSVCDCIDETRTPRLVNQPTVSQDVCDEWWARNVHQFNRFSCEYLARLFNGIPVDVVVLIYAYVGGTSDLAVFLQMRSDVDPWLVDAFVESYDGFEERNHKRKRDEDGRRHQLKRFCARASRMFDFLLSRE